MSRYSVAATQIQIFKKRSQFSAGFGGNLAGDLFWQNRWRMRSSTRQIKNFTKWQNSAAQCW